jgi:hypothetical protein
LRENTHKRDAGFLLPGHEYSMEKERKPRPVRSFILFVKENRDIIERMKQRGDFNDRQLEVLHIVERIIKIGYSD